MDVVFHKDRVEDITKAKFFLWINPNRRHRTSRHKSFGFFADVNCVRATTKGGGGTLFPPKLVFNIRLMSRMTGGFLKGFPGKDSR